MAKDLMDDDEFENAKPGAGEGFSEEQFRDDVSKVVRAREKAGKANGDVGNAVKTLEEQRGYNRKAFNLVCALAKQSSEGVADFLRTLNAGVEALKLGTTEQPDLFEDTGVDDENEEATQAKVADLATERKARKSNGKAKKPARTKDLEPVH